MAKRCLVVSYRDPDRILVDGKTWVIFEPIGGARKTIALAGNPQETDKHFHIHPDSLTPLYEPTFDFVDNFSGGLARVQVGAHWYHIRLDGQAAYTYRYLFVGSFFEEELAIARDCRGLFHIRKNGCPAYSERYDRVSNFDDGQATVSFRIDVSGKRLAQK